MIRLLAKRVSKLRPMFHLWAGPATPSGSDACDAEISADLMTVVESKGRAEFGECAE